MKTTERIKKQHIDNYRMVILESIKNNSDALVDEDLMSLIRKPPLDSMDSIKVKLLYLAKKNSVILNIEKLDNILNQYRLELEKCLLKIKNIRIESLNNVVNQIKLENDNDVIKLNKKDFNAINKEMKQIIKKSLKESYSNILIVNINEIFEDFVSEEIKDKIEKDFTKFLNSQYQKQLLESFDIKVLVKDTTLINITKENTERYLFTMTNSRLLNDL